VNYDLIVIGASWGGLNAVSEILSALPAETDAAVVVAQHRKADAVEGGLAGLLRHRANLPVTEADDKTSIEPRHVYLAPPDYHLLVQHGYFSLSTDDRVHYARPSIDVLFESAADAYRERVVGVILTGANAGVAVVQDPLTAERHEMPGAALAATAADAILPLSEIGPFLYGLLCEPAGDRLQAT
jgi:two-component system chemotaxis response regulator CheB